MSPEHVWVFADYKQAESMVVAWAGPVPRLKQWFSEGKDVHTEVTKMLAKVVQQNRVALPGGLFANKPWSEYTKRDPERETGKTTGHANNYGMGKRRFGLITGLPERYAGVLQDLYFGQMPEIRSRYQAQIIDQLRANRTITTPQGWPITFYDVYGPEMERSAFSLFAQCTVGTMITRTLCDVRECFGPTAAVKLKTPRGLRPTGLDVNLQIHDAIGVSVENNPPAINYACSVIKHYAEHVVIVGGEPLVIPMDFKVGPSWGEAVDYIPELVKL